MYLPSIFLPFYLYHHQGQIAAQRITTATFKDKAKLAKEAQRAIETYQPYLSLPNLFQPYIDLCLTCGLLLCKTMQSTEAAVFVRKQLVFLEGSSESIPPVFKAALMRSACEWIYDEQSGSKAFKTREEAVSTERERLLVVGVSSQSFVLDSFILPVLPSFLPSLLCVLPVCA